jgi:hypothetical protein
MIKWESLKYEKLFGKPFHKRSSFIRVKQLEDAELGHREASNLERDQIVGEDILLLRQKRETGFQFSSDIEVFTLFNAQLAYYHILCSDYFRYFFFGV